MHGERSSPWVDGLTIGQVLAETARLHPNRKAMVFPQLGRRWTWRQFADDVDAAARGLIALGIQRGEHVALWATNVPEWVLLQYATARIGAVLVTINPAYRPYELQYVLQQSDAMALFLVERFKTSDYFAMLGEICPTLASTQPGSLRAAEFPHLRHVVTIGEGMLPGASSWTNLVRSGNTVTDATLLERAQSLSSGDAINIQYTSGTTGFPKAAMLSHRNLLLNAYYSGVCQRITENDRICIPVPFYHCFGCVLGTLCCGVFGATMVIPGEYFQATDTLNAIEQERATSIYGVPTM